MSEKMNPEVKTQWVAALRSGDYSQGTGVLRNNVEQFCCLGVLTDLAVKSGVQMEVKEPHEAPDEDDNDYDDSLNYEEGYMYDGEWELTPEKVVEWAGFPNLESDPRVEYPGDEFSDKPYSETLSSLNDSGKTFSEIADLIEANL